MIVTHNQLREMEQLEHLVMFSSGVCSWVEAKRTVAKYGAKKTTLLFADVKGHSTNPFDGEDEDNYRFLAESAANVGAPLVKITKGESVWECFFREKMMGNSRAPICSVMLKRELLDSWQEAHCDPAVTTHLNGAVAVARLTDFMPRMSQQQVDDYNRNQAKMQERLALNREKLSRYCHGTGKILRPGGESNTSPLATVGGAHAEAAPVAAGSDFGRGGAEDAKLEPVHGGSEAREAIQCPAEAIPDPMPEAKMHDKFIQWLNVMEIKFIHVPWGKRSQLPEGWPDFTLFRNGRCVFVEFKGPDGKLTGKQPKVIEDLSSDDHDVLVTWSLKLAMDWTIEKFSADGNGSSQKGTILTQEKP